MACRWVRGAAPGRLAGSVLAGDHRPRSAEVRPPVRALPQPRAGVDCPTSTSTSARTGAIG
jgi:hypothetical protein